MQRDEKREGKKIAELEKMNTSESVVKER